MGNQRDIRSCFAQSSQSTQKKKRKTRNYYEKGFVNISDSSDDNSEFKAQHKRSKKRKKDDIGKSEESSGNRPSEIAIIDLESNNKCNNKVVPVAVPSCANEDAKANITCEFETEKSCLIREIPKLKKVMQIEHDLSSVCMPALREVLHCSPQSSNKLQLKNDLEENAGRRNENSLEGSGKATFTSVAKKTVTSEKVARTCLNSTIPTINSCTFDSSLGVRALDIKKTDRTSCSETKRTVTAAEVGSEQHASSTICSTETCSLGITSGVPGRAVAGTGHGDVRYLYLDSAEIKYCIETKGNSANDANEALGFPSKNDASKKHVDLAAPRRNLGISTSQNEIEAIDLESEVNASWSCIACTFHNHQDLSRCEMCETEKPKHFTRLIRKTHGFDTDSLASNGELEIIEMSNRKGGKGRTRKRGKETELTHGNKKFVEKDTVDCKDGTGTSADKFVIDESSTESSSWEYVDEEVGSAEMTDARLGSQRRKEPQLEFMVSGKGNSVGLLLDTDLTMPNQNCDSLNKSFARTDSTLTDSSTDIENDWNQSIEKDVSKADIYMRGEYDVPRREGEKSCRNSLVAVSCIPSTSSAGTIDKGALLTTLPLEITASNHAQDSDKTKLTPERKMKNSQKIQSFETNQKLTLSPVRTTHRQSFFSSPLLFSSPEQHFGVKTLTVGVENDHGFKTASQIFAEQRDEYLSVSDDDALLEALDSISDPVNIVHGTLSDDDDDENNRKTSQTASKQDSELDHDTDITDAANDEINDDMDYLNCDDFDDHISLIGSEKSEYSSEEEEEIVPTELFFKLSFESDRIYLYDEVRMLFV